MSQKIHYQDDLFLLSVLAKTLETSLAVEADAEFFSEHLSAEIRFLDEGIRRFHGLLSQNNHLIEKPEYLKLLERTIKSFTACLRKISSGDYPLAGEFGARSGQFSSILEAEEALLVELGGMLKEATDSASETDLVSSDELSELLKG